MLAVVAIRDHAARNDVAMRRTTRGRSQENNVVQLKEESLVVTTRQEVVMMRPKMKVVDHDVNHAKAAKACKCLT
jgi:hypothetical protein